MDTLDPTDLALLQKKEKKFRSDEETKRFELEQIEIDKHIKFVQEDLTTYFETRNGKDEISAVGAILMDKRAEEERIKKEKVRRYACLGEKQHLTLTPYPLLVAGPGSWRGC